MFTLDQSDMMNEMCNASGGDHNASKFELIPQYIFSDVILPWSNPRHLHLAEKGTLWYNRASDPSPALIHQLLQPY